MRTCPADGCDNTIPEHTGRGRPRTACSEACRKRIERQRKRITRDRNAIHEETQRIAKEHQRHHDEWVGWLKTEGKLSLRAADRLYIALLESGRLPAPGQMTIDQFLRTPPRRRRLS